MKKTLALFALLSASVVPGFAQVTVNTSDGSFSPDAWQTRTLRVDDGVRSWEIGAYDSFDTPYSTVTYKSSGGNTGSYTNIRTELGTYDSVITYQFSNSSAYNPSQQGAIDNVSLSYDLRNVANTPGASLIGHNFAVLQNDTAYTPTHQASSDTTWGTFTSTDVTSVLPQVNWTDGGEILFGFATSNGSTSTPYFTESAFDNFSVSVTPSFVDAAPATPAPPFVAALLFAAALVAKKRFARS